MVYPCSVLVSIHSSLVALQLVIYVAPALPSGLAHWIAPYCKWHVLTMPHIPTL